MNQPELSPAPPGEPIDVQYVSKPGLGWLSIKNFLLGVITLSIYRFWAKTHVRRHIWSSIHVNGEPLEYTGTGKELFIGALLIFLIIGLPIIILVITLTIMFGQDHPSIIAVQLLLILGGLMLYGMAIYRARRYRLSRTLWRGIRGTLTGSSFSYSMLYFGAMLLRSITMGWSTPAMNLNLQERITRDMEFGNREFGFKGPAGPLYKRYAFCWFMTPVIWIVAILLVVGVVTALGISFEELGTTLSGKSDGFSANDGFAITLIVVTAIVLMLGYIILWTFYTVREMNLFASYTTFDSARFRFNATTGSLVWLGVSNFLLLIFTLGIAQPFVMQRVVRYMCDRLSVDGVVNLAAIQQSTAAVDKHGEGLIDALDIDAF